jgi:hypothetical protein
MPHRLGMFGHDTPGLTDMTVILFDSMDSNKITVIYDISVITTC